MVRESDKVSTSVYKKSTNTGECLNYDSICPERYKVSVIKNFLHRAHAICSTWELFLSEVDRIKQMLINNNFPNAKVDSEIQKFIGKKRAANPQAIASPDENAPSDEDLTLFYRNQMTEEYKRDESNLRRVIRNSVKATEDTKRLKLIIYYRNRKLINIY